MANIFNTTHLSRRNNDKSCLILRQSVPKIQPHMCISLNKANRIRLIVSSTDISEEAELRLTSMLNETIKNYWVALGESLISLRSNISPSFKHLAVDGRFRNNSAESGTDWRKVKQSHISKEILFSPL